MAFDPLSGHCNNPVVRHDVVTAVGCLALLLAPWVHAQEARNLPDYLAGKRVATRKILELAKTISEEKRSLMAMAADADDLQVTNVWAVQLDQQMTGLTRNPPARPGGAFTIAQLRAYFTARYQQARVALQQRAAALVETISSQTFPKRNQRELATLRVRLMEAQWLATLAQAELSDVEALQRETVGGAK